jgi:3-oxoacyl-(acyl-carrier-protein) synthase
MRNCVIPGCYNLENAEYDVSKQLVRTSCDLKTTSKVLRTVNNSFGFGGKCASQVIEVKV